MVEANGPCSGLKVIEFATMISGPFGTQFLGDLGADVVKVEGLHGDPMRMIRPSHRGMSGMFMQFNRNKRSIAIDLKHAEGQRIARELALSADIVVENNRTGVMERLGLGWDVLSAGNPRLIYLSLSGFGDNGPYAGRPAYEHLLQGFSGVMRAQGLGAKPQGIQNMIVDKSSGVLAANAILAALLHRERSGQGQRIVLSLMGAVAAFALPEQIGNYTFLAEGVEKRGNPNTFHPVETADGAVVGYLQQRAHFEALCRTFGREDLLDDPRFLTDWDIFSRLGEVWAEMQTTASSFTNAQLLDAAAQHGVPLAPVNDFEAFFCDEQVKHLGIVTEHDEPDFGRVRQIAYPARLEASPASIRSLAPRLGNSSSVILDELGYSTTDKADLFDRKIVA